MCCEAGETLIFVYFKMNGGWVGWLVWIMSTKLLANLIWRWVSKTELRICHYYSSVAQIFKYLNIFLIRINITLNDEYVETFSCTFVSLLCAVLFIIHIYACIHIIYYYTKECNWFFISLSLTLLFCTLLKVQFTN